MKDFRIRWYIIYELHYQMIWILTTVSQIRQGVNEIILHEMGLGLSMILKIASRTFKKFELNFLKKAVFTVFEVVRRDLRVHVSHSEDTATGETLFGCDI